LFRFFFDFWFLRSNQQKNYKNSHHILNSTNQN